MSSGNNINSDKNEKFNIKIIYHQIKEGCKRKICYNIYCNNNLICQKSKNKY